MCCLPSALFASGGTASKIEKGGVPARLVGVEKRTVWRVMLQAADICQRVMEEKVRNLRSRYFQADDLSCFRRKKEKDCTFEEKDNGHHVGDT